MTSALEDAFAHHVWATLQLIDACSTLTPEQLATEVPGVYGSIVGTLGHLVASDTGYLSVLTDGKVARIDDRLDLGRLRAAMEANEMAWTQLLREELDPDAVLVRRRDDGSETHAPVGIRLAQALHHGTDHRSQICSILTALGFEPPGIDVWAFAEQAGRVVEVPPRS